MRPSLLRLPPVRIDGAQTLKDFVASCGVKKGLARLSSASTMRGVGLPVRKGANSNRVYFTASDIDEVFKYLTGVSYARWMEQQAEDHRSRSMRGREEDNLATDRRLQRPDARRTLKRPVSEWPMFAIVSVAEYGGMEVARVGGKLVATRNAKGVAGWPYERFALGQFVRYEDARQAMESDFEPRGDSLAAKHLVGAMRFVDGKPIWVRTEFMEWGESPVLLSSDYPDLSVARTRVEYQHPDVFWMCWFDKRLIDPATLEPLLEGDKRLEGFE